LPVKNFQWEPQKSRLKFVDLWTRLLSNTQHTEHLLDEASEEFKFVINIGESDHEFSDLSDHKNDGDVSGVDYYLSHLDLFYFFYFFNDSRAASHQ
jgi:hypothetical protein